LGPARSASARSNPRRARPVGESPLSLKVRTIREEMRRRGSRRLAPFKARRSQEGLRQRVQAQKKERGGIGYNSFLRAGKIEEWSSGLAGGIPCQVGGNSNPSKKRYILSFKVLRSAVLRSARNSLSLVGGLEGGPRQGVARSPHRQKIIAK